FDLWSEFTSGSCYIPALGASGPANGDYDCDGKCTSVYLRAKGTTSGSVYTPGPFISEDASGRYIVNKNPNRPTCGGGNRCATDCSPAYSSTETAPRAPYHWDAGDKLSPLTPEKTEKSSGYLAWTDRKIYTVVDDQAPLGKLTQADTTFQVKDDAATVAKLLPYLNLSRKFCTAIQNSLKAAGNPVYSTIATEIAVGTYTACGKALVQYVMGADVFNERLCSGYPGTYCTRPYQLGDVFHSSPVEVWPPLASDGLLCSRGLHTQCLPSLFMTPTPAPSTAGNSNAYDDYAKSARYKHRNKFALVGANDGMVHAIVTGKWIPGGNDPRSTADESKPPYEGYYDPNDGGQEIWAFIPPDLLSKLPLLLGATHHYYVDGTAMVRDVWIDGGTPNGLGGPAPADGVKQGSEFHTVAVMGERRGGTHYFALDVTDASDNLDAKPRFLWLYPQPDDPEQLSFGETYSEFVPTPPPIGPVRIDSGTSCAAERQFTDSTGETRCFEESWVVFLNGGFDPQLTKGRGVHMVRLSDGQEIFDFSQPPGSAATCTASSDPRCHLNFPVSGAVGMMMWGKEPHYLSKANDGFFDTATFGDAGGQLWVLRFSDPGKIDAGTGKVTNWFGARIFQHGRTATGPECDYCGGQPFFHITANVALAANGLYRVLAGTGDRFNILDSAGGRCSPDNLRACALKGCTVSMDNGAGGPGAVYGVDALGTQSYKTSLSACSTFMAAS
ncbi:MAG TPA: hypothetical protein VEA99_10715, partial [Gemmatimonadaceae bacterium]|nr:hypothetical protein [Gemmatimonadaceae bacterium]